MPVCVCPPRLPSAYPFALDTVVTHGAKELIDSITGNGYVSHSVGFIVCGRRTAAS